MLLNRQGRRMTLEANLSKNWAMTRKNGNVQAFTRPLSTLISQFNNQEITLRNIATKNGKEVSAANKQQPPQQQQTLENSPSEKSVKTFIHESKLKKKPTIQQTPPPQQVFPAFGPKSFKTSTQSKPSDLTNAFSKLVLTRQTANATKTNMVAKIDMPTPPPTPSPTTHFVALKSVESRLKVELKQQLDVDEESVVPDKPQSFSRVLDARKALFDSQELTRTPSQPKAFIFPKLESDQFVSQSPVKQYSSKFESLCSTSLKSLNNGRTGFLSDFEKGAAGPAPVKSQKKFAFLQKETCVSTDMLAPFDDGFVTFSSHDNMTKSTSDLMFLLNDDTYEDEFKDCSESFLSCSSLMPQTTLSEDTINSDSMPLSELTDLNDECFMHIKLVADEEEKRPDEESDTLNNTLINIESSFMSVVNKELSELGDTMAKVRVKEVSSGDELEHDGYLQTSFFFLLLASILIFFILFFEDKFLVNIK